jgi:hypothetical protein
LLNRLEFLFRAFSGSGKFRKIKNKIFDIKLKNVIYHCLYENPLKNHSLISILSKKNKNRKARNKIDINGGKK